MKSKTILSLYYCNLKTFNCKIITFNFTQLPLKHCFNNNNIWKRMIYKNKKNIVYKLSYI